MLRLSTNIVLGDYQFDFVNSLEVVTTWDQFTDTARITLPKNIRFLKDGVPIDAITQGNSLWKRGDKVSIICGYDSEVATRFEGFISRIYPKMPLEFECQDRMWQLKQITIDKYSKGIVTLQQLLTDILPSDIEFTADDFSFDLRFSKVTITEIFDFLKQKFGINTFFQEGKLFSGFAYKLGRGAVTHEFTFYQNIIDDSQLDYVRDDDVKLNVTVVNVKPDNTRVEVSRGDSDGEKRTIYTYNVPDSTLANIADENIERLKYEGYRGSFVTFLNPKVKHGDNVKLVDPKIPDRNGVYLVKQVTTTSGISGGRQEIFLDRKL